MLRSRERRVLSTFETNPKRRIVVDAVALTGDPIEVVDPGSSELVASVDLIFADRAHVW